MPNGNRTPEAVRVEAQRTIRWCLVMLWGSWLLCWGEPDLLDALINFLTWG